MLSTDTEQNVNYFHIKFSSQNNQAQYYKKIGYGAKKRDVFHKTASKSQKYHIKDSKI